MLSLKVAATSGVGALALAVAGCSGGDETQSTTTATQESVTYLMSFTATPRGSSMLVRGRTNLPDGAVVSVSASQAFRFKRESDARASRVAGANAKVEDGKFVTMIGPLDYGDVTVGLERGVGDADYGPVTLVDNAVTVCAVLPTGEDDDGVARQPDEAVQEALGRFGENLKSSPQATKFGSLTPTPSYQLQVVKRVRGAAPRVLAAIATAQGSTPAPRRLSGFCV
jgi:hypothetical protein